MIEGLLPDRARLSLVIGQSSSFEMMRSTQARAHVGDPQPGKVIIVTQYRHTVENIVKMV